MTAKQRNSHRTNICLLYKPFSSAKNLISFHHLVIDNLFADGLQFSDVTIQCISTHFLHLFLNICFDFIRYLYIILYIWLSFKMIVGHNDYLFQKCRIITFWRKQIFQTYKRDKRAFQINLIFHTSWCRAGFMFLRYYADRSQGSRYFLLFSIH